MSTGGAACADDIPSCWWVDPLLAVLAALSALTLLVLLAALSACDKSATSGVTDTEACTAVPVGCAVLWGTPFWTLCSRRPRCKPFPLAQVCLKGLRLSDVATLERLLITLALGCASLHSTLLAPLSLEPLRVLLAAGVSVPARMPFI